MAKHKPKAAEQVKIASWLSANRDCREGRFIQVGNSFLLSKKSQKLSTGAFRLHLCMAMESGGKREFKFSKSTAAKYGIAYQSFRRHLKELLTSGFIEGKQKDYVIGEETVYQFSFVWKPK